MAVSSNKFAGIFLPPSVRNEVTDFVSVQRNAAICKIGEVLFFREIAEGVFVMSHNQRDTGNFGTTNDSEIKRD